MKKGTGDFFQKETQYIRGKIGGGPLLWQAKPKTYKHYPKAPKYKLKVPQKEGGMPLWEAINLRHSFRNFKDQPMKKDIFSQLLWATQGITHESMGFEFRAAPSAGALYPVETYLALHNVEEFESGIYHYGVQNHEIEQLKKGDFREAAARAALDQDLAYSASVV
ncbi:MAG: SagB/ThcOx family dehydrogenase, partial [Candidatus Aminicenantes bacterium]